MFSFNKKETTGDHTNVKPEPRSILPLSEKQTMETKESENGNKRNESDEHDQGVSDVTAKALYEGPQKCKCCINWVEEYPDSLKNDLESAEENHSHALLLRYARSHRRLGSPMQLDSITVQSPYLKDLVGRLFRDYPRIDYDKSRPSFFSPFKPFFFKWTELQREKDECVDAIEKQHIELLVKYLTEELQGDLRSAESLAKNSQVTYALVWTLFPPGSVAVGAINGVEHFFLVVDSTYQRTMDATAFYLDMLSLDCNGATYGWSSFKRSISEFSGVRSIIELDTVPYTYCTKGSALATTLAERGRKAILLSNGAYKSYQGTVQLSRNSSTLVALIEEREQYIDGRILIDPSGYFRHARDKYVAVTDIPSGLHSLLQKDKVVDDDLSERYMGPIDPLLGGYHVLHNDNYPRSPSLRHHGRSNVVKETFDPYAPAYSGLPMDVNDPMGLGPMHNLGPDLPSDEANKKIFTLNNQLWTSEKLGFEPEVFCRSVVRGYCLESKNWAEFEVDNIEDIEWNDQAFDQLVMVPARKQLLKTLVEEHCKCKKEFDDIIKGKGQGLVLLFQGPPGTGKTLTAESIADHLRLPLYPLQASQLGNEPLEIEDTLSQVLRLTGAWNAVLLLDEADAFLEKRQDDPSARQRNKRVAAFLRVLEYYKGILILTTNRPTNFDTAFYSRIHLTIKFPAIDETFRRAVWQTFLKPADTALDHRQMDEVVGIDLNGRQIKNVVKMARLLAEHANRTLNIDDIRSVLNILCDTTLDSRH